MYKRPRHPLNSGLLQNQGMRLTRRRRKPEKTDPKAISQEKRRLDDAAKVRQLNEWCTYIKNSSPAYVPRKWYNLLRKQNMILEEENNIVIT